MLLLLSTPYHVSHVTLCAPAVLGRLHRPYDTNLSFCASQSRENTMSSRLGQPWRQGGRQAGGREL